MADTTGDAPRSDFKVRVLRDGVQTLAKQLPDLLPAMARIGDLLVRVARISFLNQSFNGKRWDPKVAGPTSPSIMGSVQDLAQGPSIHPSRYDPKALVDTGALRRSIRAYPTAKTVRIASDLPYAALHHAGGPSSLPVTATVKRNLATFLRGNKGLRAHLGFLFRRDEVETDVPARPFLGMTDQARQQAQQIMQDYLLRRAREA